MLRPHQSTAESQTITIALAQEPPQLNGMKATDQVSIRVLSHSMEGLTRYDRRGNLRQASQPGGRLMIKRRPFG